MFEPNSIPKKLLSIAFDRNRYACDVTINVAIVVVVVVVVVVAAVVEIICLI
jgi:hypothetical protein